MKYRSRVEIISSILHVTRTGATKTQIMYRVYLSYSQAKEYLGFLIEKGLLKVEAGTQTYQPTDKGIRFLRAAERAEGLLGLEVGAPGDDQAPFSLR
jgi:predicted transcriptional regulator